MPSTRGADKGPALARLQFKEKLTGPSDILQKKLKTLFDELQKLGQGECDLNSLNTVKKELMGQSLLLHKDRGVKAHTACCLAELLRLYAPDAPYTANELRDMFTFFFKQLSTGLRPESPYFHQYFLLVESLSTVKSIVLVCDLPHADELISTIFRECFVLVRTGDLGRNIEMYLADILSALIDECHAVPSDTLNAIIAQYHADAPQNSQRLAATVCTNSADKLQRNVCQYFTDILLTSTSGSNRGEEDEDEEDPGTAGADIGALKTAHNLIHSMSISSPAILHNVIPLLEQQLRTEDLHLRSLATKTLGGIFSNSKTGIEMVKKFQSCWKAWLQRKFDKHAHVRMVWVEALKDFIGGSEWDAVEVDLANKIFDPDERVRTAVCRLFGDLPYETLITHVHAKHLRSVGDRIMDKKNTVRVEAVTTLGKVWSMAWNDIEARDRTAIVRFSWIPPAIFHAITHSVEAKQVAEDTIQAYIFPLPPKDKLDSQFEVSWVDRLLITMRFLDEKAIANMLAMTPLKSARPSVYEHYLGACAENNGGIIDENEEDIKRRLSTSISILSNSYTDPHKAGEDLYSFAKHNDVRLFKLLRTCMDPTVDVKNIAKAMIEFTKRVEQSQSSVSHTLSTALRRSSYWMINVATLRILIRLLATSISPEAEIEVHQEDFTNACRIIHYAAKFCPAMVEGVGAEAAKVLSGAGVPDFTGEREEELEGVETRKRPVREACLAVLAGMAKRNDEGGKIERGEPRRPNPNAGIEARVQKLARNFALGNHGRSAKFAARILAHAKERKNICQEAVEAIAADLKMDVRDDMAEARVTVLSEFAKAVPDALNDHIEAIMRYLTKDVLLRTIVHAENAASDDWLEDNDVPPSLRAKIQALKFARNRCLAVGNSQYAADLAQPVLEMYFTLLANGGTFNPEQPESPGVLSRMRLAVATCLLELTSVEAYRQLILNHFIDLALTIQDPVFNVRIAFLQKIITGLHQHKLDRSFNIVLFLTILDPERESSDKAKSYVAFAQRRHTKEQRISNLEMTFIRLLHLLAHHPDFDVEEIEGLRDFTKYLSFYLDLLATADNLPLLFHLAMKAKTVRDAQSQRFSERLYILSEVAQEMIKTKAKNKSWSLPSYPGKIKLPSDIFKPLPNAEAASQILKRTYMPDELTNWLLKDGKPDKEQVHKPRTRVTHEQTYEEDEIQEFIPRKKKSHTGTQANAGSKRKRGRPRKKRKESSVEEDEEEQSEVSEIEAPPSKQSKSSPVRRRIKDEEPEIKATLSDSAETDEDTIVNRRTRAKTRRASQRASGKVKSEA